MSSFKKHFYSEKVQAEFGIKIDFSILNFNPSKNLETTPLLDALGNKLGLSLFFITPPTESCLLCDNPLDFNNEPSQVVTHTLSGPRLVSKYIMRCVNCPKTWKLSISENDHMKLSGGRGDILCQSGENLPSLRGNKFDGWGTY